MPALDPQELIALAIVAAVVLIGAWRWAKRRRSGAAACGHCDKPAAKPKEVTLRFHRRKP